jgi:maltose O-acetyltransferase
MAQLREVARDVVLNRLIASALIPRSLGRVLLRWAGLDVGRAAISAGCFFGGRRVSIGSGTFVNHECFFDNSAPIRVGVDCAIGMRTSIVTASHELGSPQRRAGANTAAPVVIEDGCWIGANVTILARVTIGHGTVVAAGAVVTEDCKSDAIYAGVPARQVRSL